MSITLPLTRGNIGNFEQLTVDARALHSALEVKRDFSTWIKARIAKYNFVEGEDYEKSSMITDSPIRGSQAAIEYRLSVNMGKELAMVENNERGKLVRRYFIECERRLHMPDPCLSVEDRRPLSNLIGQWAGKAKMSFPDCWRELHTVFSISTVAALPATMLPAALAWVQAKIDALEARRAPELPAPEPSPAFPVEIAQYDGKNFWKDLEDIVKRITAINSALTLNARTGCLMKHEFYADTINNQVGLAQGSLILARAALGDALRLKGRRDVWK